MPITLVISGGQTGVDRAALDAAKQCGIDIGGTVPRGRESEDMADLYKELVEVDERDESDITNGCVNKYYPDALPHVIHKFRSRLARTRNNVQHSDATLILTTGSVSTGSQATIDYARQANLPFRVVDLSNHPHTDRDVAEWIRQHRIQTLNVAGPTENENPGIYRVAKPWLIRVLELTSSAVS